MIKNILLGICGFVVAIVLAFALNLGGLEWNRFFGTRSQSVQRDIFEHTKSFIDGKTNHLNQLRAEYELAEGASKVALRTIILREAGQVDMSLLPFNLQQFINSLN